MLDKGKIKKAVKLFLEAIGEDIKRDGLVNTPDRVARMCEEIFGGIEENAKKYLTKTFIVNNSEIVLEKNILFYSVCEHHLLPFYGNAHIAYLPSSKVVGLSKLARTVEIFARRPQIQEQMTIQIADDIMKYLKPKGIMVMLEAEHMCMSMRGIKKPGSKTVTIARRGCFEKNVQLQNDFFQIIGGEVVNNAKICSKTIGLEKG